MVSITCWCSHVGIGKTEGSCQHPEIDGLVQIVHSAEQIASGLFRVNPRERMKSLSIIVNCTNKGN